MGQQISSRVSEVGMRDFVRDHGLDVGSIVVDEDDPVSVRDEARRQALPIQPGAAGEEHALVDGELECFVGQVA